MELSYPAFWRPTLHETCLIPISVLFPAPALANGI
jgi:hypothetical protein